MKMIVSKTNKYKARNIHGSKPTTNDKEELNEIYQIRTQLGSTNGNMATLRGEDHV